MPDQHSTHDQTRDDDGPEWTARGVELHVADADRAQLQDYGIHLLLTTVEESLAAIAAMRRRQAPTAPDPQRALSAAAHLRRTAAALQAELLASGWLSHGRAAAAMGVPRTTAQRARESADRDDAREWSYRHAIGHRPQGTPAREWYGTADQADAVLSVSVPGGDLPVQIRTSAQGRRSVTTASRVIVVNGSRMVIRDGQTRTAHGFTWHGTPEGIEGYED